jgi:hypothetical protein
MAADPRGDTALAEAPHGAFGDAARRLHDDEADLGGNHRLAFVCAGYFFFVLRLQLPAPASVPCDIAAAAGHDAMSGRLAERLR